MPDLIRRCSRTILDPEHQIHAAGCLAVVLIAGACEGGLVTQGTPRGEARETGNSLEIHVTLDSAEDSLAAVLGWQDGVPYARVIVLANGTAAWDTLEADATGRVMVPGLSGGLYRIYAERFLTDAEQALVGMPRAFADGRGVHVSGPTAVALRLYADRPASLVISEIGGGTPPPWETNGSYFGGLYFEIYNNSEETLYLDGVIFGDTGPYSVSLPDPCPTTESVRTDSLGIYAIDVLAFPGGGLEYPIGPGETRLVAWQAIDHREVHPTLLDLSDADFEVAAGGGADNPDVPNMLQVGLRAFAAQTLLTTSRVYFLAEPQDPRGLPIAHRSASGTGYVRIPRETLMDVAAITTISPAGDAEGVPCQPMVSPVFDRYEGGLYEIGFDTETLYRSVRGVQRRALRRTPDGRIILMNTNTSAVDFEHALKTPGWVPEPPEN